MTQYVLKRWKQDIYSKMSLLEGMLNNYETNQLPATLRWIYLTREDLDFLVSHYAINHSQEDYEKWNKIHNNYLELIKRYDKVLK